MVWCIRFAIFYFSIVALTLLLFPLVIVAYLLKLDYRYKYLLPYTCSRAYIWLAKIIFNLKYQVSGLEKLPKGPAVFISNHQSYWENFFVQLIVPMHSWVMKKEIFNIPIFGWAARMMDPIAVDRKDHMSVAQILEQGKKKLDQGLWIIIFPESTRVAPLQYKKYKPSAAKLAMDAKVPIVLMSHNAGLFWPPYHLVAKPGVVNVKILSVIYPDEFLDQDARTMTAKIENIINDAKDLAS